jgi:hypothetical protein
LKTRVLVLLSLLVGMGAVLHAVMPGPLAGMKLDLMLTMMFLGITLFPERKNVLLVGIVAGVISALTTTFPGGQIPNIIDKPVAAFMFYGLLLMAGKYKHSVVVTSILAAVGTLVSGTVFLTLALFMAGLPGTSTFSGLFIAIVLPTAAMSAVLMAIVYPIAKQIVSRSNIPVQA